MRIKNFFFCFKFMILQLSTKITIPTAGYVLQKGVREPSKYSVLLGRGKTLQFIYLPKILKGPLLLKTTIDLPHLVILTSLCLFFMETVDNSMLSLIP